MSPPTPGSHASDGATTASPNPGAERSEAPDHSRVTPTERADPTAADLSSRPPAGLWRDAASRLLRNKLALIALAVIAVYVVVALGVALGLIAANWDETVAAAYQPPGQDTALGTDFLGLSVWRKTLYGAKISLTVASLGCVIALGIGVPLGLLAGFFRGFVDEFVVWLYSTVASIPGLLLIMAFAYVLRDKSILGYELKGMPSVYLAIGLTSWVGICRLIRGEVIKHKDRDYVTAARAFGAGKPRMMFRHVLPNVSHLILIDFSLAFVSFIHAEVILSFLGLGVTDEPSWGRMIDDARLELSRGVWWQMAAATAAIFGISLAINVFADALRDALDPKLRGVT